ncbi:hypothetical protein BDN70DRAFT_585396 [Pholiota conissans]|uniref:F-box domain-containing protein n=1 Tax=Pholiota conissans TaxID=109636 RepID=A0A9P5Z667_9AGAR|nr:hypothetical protein BDN70DRAFT_585396 [Pholiota conissans]
MSETHGLLSLNCNTSTAEAHRLIDEALKRPGALVLALKSQRNAFVPISSLPPEILCKIFSDVKDKEPSTPNESFKLTHVCRHWRNVGIGLSALWTELVLRNPEVTELMVARSKGAPLVIKTPNFDSYINSNRFAALKMSLEHLHRVKDLTLYTTEEQWPEVYDLFPKSAVHLNCLRVFAKSNHRLAFVNEGLLQETLQLRHLELSNFSISWKAHSHLLHSLTHLVLQKVSFRGLSWRELADALKRMPGLQVLSLSNATPEVDNEPVTWSPTHLASLRSLSMTSNDKGADILLSSITFPETAKTCFDCFVPSQTDVDFSSIFQKLGKIYSDLLPDDQYKTLILIDYHTIMPGLKVKLFSNAFAEEKLLKLKPKVTPSDLEFNLHWISTMENDRISAKIFNDLLNSGVPLQNVGRVFLTTPFPWVVSPQVFADTIGKLAQPISVLTTGGSAEMMVNALLVPDPSSGGTTGAKEKPYFSNLTSIFLHKARFEVPDMGDGSYINFKNLHRGLAERAQCGAKLGKLVFMYCNRVLKPDVDALAKFVGEVDCDSQDLHLGIDRDGGPVQPRRLKVRRAPKPQNETSKRKKKNAT